MFKKTILLVLIFFVFLPIEANAQTKPNEILNISPLILNISLSPGKEYEYEFKIKNLLSTPLPLKAYFENFTTTDEEGGYTFEDKPNPFLSWLEISESDMIIPAKSEKVLKLQAKIPSKVPFGGYYGVLFFEPLITQETSDGSLISAKVGALLLANVGTTEKISKAEILDFKVKRLLEGSEADILLRVRNSGLNHFSAKPILKIKPLLGQEQVIEIEEKFVFPGKVRRWEQNIELENKWRGIYKSEIAVSVGEGRQVFSTSYFVSFPISITIVILLSISAITFLIAKRKKLAKALKILVKNG